MQVDWAGRGLLIPTQKKVISSPLFLNKLLMVFFFSFSFPATRSCHHRLLCCCPRTRGPGRDVFQQLLPLPALRGGSEGGDSPGPVGAQREADPGGTRRPGQLSRSSGDDGNTRPSCVPARHCQRCPLPNLLPRPFCVPLTLIRQSQGNKSSHSRWENVKYQWEAGN